MNKDIRGLLTFMSKASLCYHPENKDKFKKSALLILRRLAHELGLKEFDVRFNPGGIAVSGDAVLHGMWDDGVGFYLCISKFAFSSGPTYGYYRTCTSLRDYTGGQNHALRLDKDVDYVRAFLSLKPVTV
jgi:hypothetical protein